MLARSVSVAYGAWRTAAGRGGATATLKTVGVAGGVGRVLFENTAENEEAPPELTALTQ